MPIMSITDIIDLLRTQAALRAQENDEAAVLLAAADEIEDWIAELSQPLETGDLS